MKEYVFISYKFEKKAIALKIKNLLEENGISCWMAPESIPGGASYASEITKAIDKCKEVVVILSKSAQESQYVTKEIDSAIKRKKIILPLMIEDFALNPTFDYYFTDVQFYDANVSWEAAVERMIREIRCRFHSINVSPSPDSICRDPIVIRSTLPHCFEEDYLLFGRYRVKKMLGIYQGGTIQHYHAIDEHMDREVLVEYSDRSIPKSVRSEPIGVSTAGTFIQHPFIASAIDEYSNEAYFIHVEPFYNVKSLNEIIIDSGSMPFRAVIKWAKAVCDALIYLHEEKGYIFGQLNSTNIRIQKNGFPILFDVSCATRINEVVSNNVGEDAMLPESAFPVIKGKTTVDVYALGATIYYALTGKRYVLMNNIIERKRRVLDYGQEAIPDDLVKIINKCMEMDVKKRYQSIREVLLDLENVRENHTKRFFLFRRK